MSDLDLRPASPRIHRSSSFEVPPRYRVLELVGQGAYGIVCAAQDQERKETVAIKKIENVFEHWTYAMQTLRELRILRHLRHENLMDLRQVYYSGTKEVFESVYVVSGLMETDLASIIKSSQPLSNDHCQFFSYQIFRGLKYMHSADVIHRDLRPRNLLVNRSCDLKIIDYTCASILHADEELRTLPTTRHISTFWYSAPEVLGVWANPGKAIDIWSAGCVVAEMFRRKPLFLGKSTRLQFQLIISCVGTPSWESLQRTPGEGCRRFLRSVPRSEGKPLEEALPGAPEDALDLLRKILRFSPDDRLTAEGALQHPFFLLLHCPEDEPVTAPIDISDFSFERRPMDMQLLREEVFLEALRYHPPLREKYLQELRQGESVYSVLDHWHLSSGGAGGESEDYAGDLSE